MTDQPTDWVQYTAPGVHVVEPPAGAVRLDAVCLGGGAGGGYNGWGSAGSWRADSTTDIGPVTIIVGAGGVNSTDNGNQYGAGGPGGESSVGSITGAGGVGTTNGSKSVSAAGSLTAFDRTFTGGASVGAYSPGNKPGGGGGAGAGAGKGAVGAVWIRWWVQDKIEKIYAGGVFKFTGSTSAPVRFGPCTTAQP